jgi:hypothetical protein
MLAKELRPRRSIDQAISGESSLSADPPAGSQVRATRGDSGVTINVSSILDAAMRPAAARVRKCAGRFAFGSGIPYGRVGEARDG